MIDWMRDKMEKNQKEISLSEENQEITDEKNPEEELITVSYDLTEQEVRKGLKRFQKETQRKRKWVYTILFCAIIGINLFDMIFRGNTSGYTYLFVGVSIAVIFIIWYTPYRHREQVAMAISQEKMTFSMNLYPDSITVETEDGIERFQYENPQFQVIEQSDQFVIVVGKDRIYLLPKRCMQSQEIKKAKEYFTILDSRYQNE